MLPNLMLALIIMCTISASIIGMDRHTVTHDARKLEHLNKNFVELPTYMTPTVRLFDAITQNDAPSAQEVLEQNQISQNDIHDLISASIVQTRPEITSILIRHQNVLITNNILKAALNSTNPIAFMSILENAPSYQIAYDDLVTEYSLALLQTLNKQQH